MREIILHSRKYTGLVALVDDEDFIYLNQYRWNVNYDNRYSVNYANTYNPFVLMHRIILAAPPGLMVDHIDHDGLNNQRLNLRLATNSQNQANSKTTCGSSKYKGVSWHKQSQKWQVKCRVNRKRYYLGCFPTEEEASAVYINFAKIHFGEFCFEGRKI